MALLQRHSIVAKWGGGPSQPMRETVFHLPLRRGGITHIPDVQGQRAGPGRQTKLLASGTWGGNFLGGPTGRGGHPPTD